MTAPTVQRPVRTCSVDGCDRKHEAKGFCKAHWKRKRDGTQVDGPIRPCGQRRSGDAASYLRAHRQVYRERGQAGAHQCAHCERRAHHWAYDHADPNAKPSRDGLFSTDVGRYIPLCSSCHRRFDVAHANDGFVAPTIERPADATSETHCLRGHPYDALNTFYRKKGGPRCRECHRLTGRARTNPALKAWMKETGR